MKIIKRLLLLCGSVLLGFVLVETGLRLFPPEDFLLVFNNSKRMQPDELLGHSMRPNIKMRLQSEGGGTYIATTNSYGLRADAYNGKSGKKNILGIGDSLLWAAGVNREEGMFDLLQLQLDIKYPGQYRTINAGVGGYSTHQEILYYTERGERDFDPDVVMLFYFINDINLGNVRSKRVHGIPLPEYIPGKPAWQTAFTPRTWDYYKYWKSVQNQKVMADTDIEPTMLLSGMAHIFNRMTFPTHKSRVYEKLGYMIRILKEKTSENGAKLVVVYVPTAHEVEEGLARQNFYKRYAVHISRWDWATPNMWVSKVMEQLGVHFINLVPPFQSHWNETNTSLYFNGDGHLTFDGHKLAVENIVPALADVLEK